MKRVILGMATVAFGVMASTAAAQNTMGSMSGVGSTGGVGIGIMGGADFPTGDFANAVKTGFNIGGLVDFTVPMIPIGLRADVTYNQASFKNGVPAKSKIFGGDLNAMFKVPMDVGFSPYLTGGVGFYNLRVTSDDATLGQTLDTGSQNKFALNGGGGVQFNLGGLAAFVEARYLYIFTDNSRTAMIPVSVGLMFRP